jgi:hypothetical protein
LKDSSQELRVNKKYFWEYLCKNYDHCLSDIIHHGMKRSDASFLILEEAAADYHLSGPLGEFMLTHPRVNWGFDT